MIPEARNMRDVFIEQIYYRMQEDKDIFFLCADFGSPKLDALRKKFKKRFINVGIAEQNLINISTGLALEGYKVYAYAIAPFLVMRAYEQIRVNLSLHAQLRDININLIGVGAGLSYDVSGPTHHCLEDLGIMRMLPNIEVFSPSDWVLTRKFVDYSLAHKKPKYIRLDGKPLPRIYEESQDINIKDGFFELFKGSDCCIVSTGYMTHKAIRVREALKKENLNIGVIDAFLLKPFDESSFANVLKRYKYVLTLEEAFIGKGGLDTLVSNVITDQNLNIKLKRMGFGDSYVFEIGGREYLHKLNGLGVSSIANNIEQWITERKKAI